VYCVIAASRPPRLSRVPPGLPGLGPVRLLAVKEDLFAAVADAPPDRFGEAAIRRWLGDLDQVSRAAIAHDTVVASFASETAVLPMRLFTLFASDARALEHVRSQHGQIATLVKRVAHHQEWGVRVVRPRARAAAPTKVPAGVRSGAAYLAHKKAEHEAPLERGADPSGEMLGGLYDRLAARAGLAKRRPTDEPRVPGARLLLDAAFLVPRAQTASFEALASRESRRFARHGYRLMLSGPWPPYSFMQE
jgi:Gas vesicle synthesis protein GvpL/GvpF